MPSTYGLTEALDGAYLKRATFGDTALRTEIVGLFLSQVNSLANRLNLPMDQRSWQFLTHTLKGSASAVGALHLSDLAHSWDMEPAPTTGTARQAYATTLKAALLDFERAAANLH
jgi:HPt (histidine-containing phosphotransfer) domain-containing protein